MFTNLLDKIDFVRKIFINTLFIIFLLIFFLLLIITPFMSKTVNTQDSILLLDASTQMQESSPLSGSIGLSNFQIVETIELATKDDDISLILMDTSLMNLSATDAIEIGEALNDFKSKGKKVISYGDFYFQNQYLLASYSDEIILNPFGLVYLEGYKNYRFYLKEALNKIDVNINTFIAGDYKSAAEIFTNSSMSEDSKKESERFLTSLWEKWKFVVSNNRDTKLSINIQNYIDDIGNLISNSNKKGSNLATDFGLVDSIMNRSDMEEYIFSITNNKKEYFLNFYEYIQVNEPAASENKLALIDAKGEIVDGDFYDNELSSGHFSRLINKVKDGDYRGLLIRLNTPGGSGFASEIIRQEIIELKDSGIPVIISMADIATSGGYWISADANEIWASDFSLTGSIGVWTALPDFNEGLKNIGINYDGVSTTDFNPSLINGPDDNTKLLIQNVVNSAYEFFLEIVAEGRNMDKSFAKKIAEGKIWSSEEAKDLNLIDEIGSQRESLNRLAELSNLKEYSVELIEEDISVFDQIGYYFADFLPKSIENKIFSTVNLSVPSYLLTKNEAPFPVNMICLECLIN